MRTYYVYILSNKRNGTLYIGLTNDLERRMREHKTKVYRKSFSARYSINKLLYFEEYSTYYQALSRERQLKKWNRKWKLRMIEENNKDWYDLSENW